VCPEQNLPAGIIWSFRLVDAPVGGGAWWFRWEVHDSMGKVVQDSGRPFETLTECMEDAKQKGYVEPEQRV
jgi:hypothetical protein